MIDIDIRLPLARFTLRIAVRLHGEAVAVLGPSGSGKTSLLEAIAGLRRGASGRIAISGEVLMDSASGIFLAPERRRIGFVPQDACLFPHLDAEGNVRFGMKPGADSRIFEEAVAILEIGSLLPRYPATLSGGERQRVALARAIATVPRLLLLDEPLAAVDVELKERILPYLLRVREQMRLPFLYVTHNAGEASAVAEEAVLLREGAVALQGRTDTVLQSMTLSLIDPEARFENILTGTLESADASDGTALLRVGEARLLVPVGGPPIPRSGAIYAVSPEDILVSTEPPEHVSARNLLRGSVVSEHSSEAGTWIRVVAAGVEWTVRLTRAASEDLRLRPGATAWLAVKTHAFRPLR